MTHGNRQRVAQVCLLVAVLSLPIFAWRLRTPSFGEGTQNLEATYHVLLVFRAYDESPLSSHWMLPLSSLGRPNDKGIPWGKTVPTERGDYIYTSFTAPGFAVPYLLFKALHAQPSIRALTLFNFALLALSCVLLGLIVSWVLREQPSSRSSTLWAVGSALAVLLYSREGLQTFGAVYWSHQLQTVLSLAQIWLGLVLLTTVEAAHGRARLLGFGLLAFASAYTEWTGFVTNGLMIVAFAVSGVRHRIPSHRRAAVVLIAASVLAGAAILIHLSMVLEFGPTISTLLARF